MEGVEADADGKTDFEVGNVHKRQIIERFGDHSRIFEDGENTDIQRTGDNQKQLFLLLVASVPVDQPAAYVVDDDVDQHQGHKQRFAPAVENQIDKKEKQIAPFARRDVIDQQRQRQIRKEKD